MAADYLLRGMALVKHNLSLAGQVRVRGHLRETFTRAGLASFWDVTTVGDSVTYIMKYASSGVARSWNYDASGNRSRLIEGARTNLTTYSEQLDNAAWTKSNTTIAANATAAPDGYTTADKVVENTATSTHQIGRVYTKATSAIAYTLSAYVKAAGQTAVYFETDDAASNGATCLFNLADGTAGTPTANAFAAVSATIEDAGNGWFRCALMFTTTTTASLTTNIKVKQATAYAGSTANGLYIWGVTVEVGPFMSSYISTENYYLGFQGYLDLPGASGAYASSPDSGPLSVTGDIDIQCWLAMDDWTPAADMTLVGKLLTGTNQRSYGLKVATSGVMQFFHTTDGTSSTQGRQDSTAAPTVTDGAALWVRVTMDVNNGASGYDTKFYTGGNAPTPIWTQLGSTVTTSTATSIYDGSALLELGSMNAGAVHQLAGKIYRARIYSDLTETTKVYDADFTDISTHAATRLSITEKANSAVVTVNSVASAATSRTVERLKFAITGNPAESSIYIKFVEQGTLASGNFGPLMVGGNGTGTGNRLQLEIIGGKYALRFLNNDAGTNSLATAAAATAIGDTVELRCVINENASVTLGQKINSGSEATVSGSSIAMAATWNDNFIHLSTDYTFTQLQSLKFVTGTKTLAEMQALRPEDDNVLLFDEPYDSQWVKAYGTIYAADSELWGEPVPSESLSAENYAAGARQDFVQLFSQTEKFGNILVDFSDVANADGYVQVGRGWFGNRYQPSINFVPGAEIGWLDDMSTSQRADGGAEFFDQRPRRRKFNGSFENIPSNEALVQMYEMSRRWGISAQFFFVYDPDDTIHLDRRSFLATLSELSRLRIPFASWASQPVSVVEVI